MTPQEKTSKGLKLAMLLASLSAAMGVALLMVGNALWKADESSSSATAIAMSGVGLALTGFIVFCVVRFKIWWATG